MINKPPAKPVASGAEPNKKPDQIAKIMGNPKLNGYQRAKAVAKHIKERGR